MNNMALVTILLLALYAVSSECGVIPKIVGSGRVEVDPGSFPFYGYVYNVARQELITSGILIKPRVFLTIGSNYFAMGITKPEEIEVVLGTHNRSRDEPSRQAINVTQILINPQNFTDAEGDLALIQLATPIVKNRRVKVFSVNNINEDLTVDRTLFKNAECVSMGYGLIKYTEYEKILPRTLQMYSPQMKSVRTCKDKTKAEFDLVLPRNKWLCSINDDLTEGRPYDGGNPLLCFVEGSETPTLHGLTSGGWPFYSPSGWNFFVQLAGFKQWIVDNSRLLNKA